MQEIVHRDCECWEQTVSLKFLDMGFPKEALRHVYCPRCSQGIRKDEGCMTEEKGWLIEFDPKSLRPPFGTVRLVQNHKKIGSLVIYTERGGLQSVQRIRA